MLLKRSWPVQQLSDTWISHQEGRCSNVWLTHFHLEKSVCTGPFFIQNPVQDLDCRVLANRQSCYHTVAMLSSSQHTWGRYNSRRSAPSPRLLFSYSSSSLLFWCHCDCSQINNGVVKTSWWGLKSKLQVKQQLLKCPYDKQMDSRMLTLPADKKKSYFHTVLYNLV